MLPPVSYSATLETEGACWMRDHFVRDKADLDSSRPRPRLEHLTGSVSVDAVNVHEHPFGDLDGLVGLWI